MAVSNGTIVVGDNRANAASIYVYDAAAGQDSQVKLTASVDTQQLGAQGSRRSDPRAISCKLPTIELPSTT